MNFKTFPTFITAVLSIVIFSSSNTIGVDAAYDTVQDFCEAVLDGEANWGLHVQFCDGSMTSVNMTFANLGDCNSQFSQCYNPGAGNVPNCICSLLDAGGFLSKQEYGKCVSYYNVCVINGLCPSGCDRRLDGSIENGINIENGKGEEKMDNMSNKKKRNLIRGGGASRENM